MNRRLIISAMMSMYLALAITNAAFAQDFHPVKEDFKAPKKEYSPYVEDHFPNRVYFGDTHLHTSKVRDEPMPITGSNSPLLGMGRLMTSAAALASGSWLETAPATVSLRSTLRLNMLQLLEDQPSVSLVQLPESASDGAYSCSAAWAAKPEPASA